MIEDLVIKDALRYLGAKGEDESATALLKRVLDEHASSFSPRMVTACFRLKDRTPALTFENCSIVLEGESIRRHFEGATEAIFSAFTLGASFDRKLRELSLSRPSESVTLNALGSAYAERKADELLGKVREEKEKEGFRTNFRFCPGYGDLPLKTNADILAVLDAAKKIGLTVTESGLLLPVKSIVGVTACLPL